MSVQHVTSDISFPAAVVPIAVAAPPLRRFTVDQYHRMIETGILGENDRVELVDGWIIEMSPIGPPHVTCVNLIVAALQDRLPAGWNVRTQSPVTLETGEPEPDLAIVRGNVRDYSDRHPGGADIGLLIEVADASLQFDRTQKRLEYARAGIAQYWIVNLVNRNLEAHRNPAGGDYTNREVIGADGSVELALGGKSIGKLNVADFLP
jgi:Uma2 family endonuclease